jgi:hypothetical protein
MARRCVDVSYLCRGLYRPYRGALSLSADHPAIPLTTFSPSGHVIIHTPDFLPDPITFSGKRFDNSPHREFARQYLSEPDFDYKRTRYYKLAVRGRLPFPCHGPREAERRCREYIYLIRRLQT